MSRSRRRGVAERKQVQTTLHDLPDNCLELIFQQLSGTEKVTTLPLVCKRWNVVLENPSKLWEVLNLGEFKLPSNLTVNKEAQEGIIKWFSKRGRLVRALRIEVVFNESFLFYMVPYVAAELLSFALVAPAYASFVELRRLVGFLPTFHKLEHLQLVMESAEYNALQANNCFYVLKLLPNLISISMYPRRGGKDSNTIRADFPLELLELTNLTSLLVQSTTLPNQLTILSNLKQVQVFGLGVPSFPDVVSKLRDLNKLLVIWNPETQWEESVNIPHAISKLTDLQSLTLNGLSSLPTTGEGLSRLGLLTSLTHLDLDKCQLTEIPSFISKLTNLKELMLNGNKIARIPEWFLNSTEVELLELDVQNCGEGLSIPSGITKLVKLHRLVFRGCTFSSAATVLHLHVNSKVMVPVTVTWDENKGDHNSAMKSQRVDLTLTEGSLMSTVLTEVQPFLSFLMPILRRKKKYSLD